MLQIENNSKIKECLSSILLGYSVSLLEDQKVFIKHNGYCDLIETDFQYNQAFQDCIKNNIYTEKRKIDLLIKQNLWSVEQDVRINFLKDNIDKLVTQKVKSLIPSQKKLIEQDIKNNETELENLLNKKNDLVGITAEMIATKRSEDFYIFKSFYLNPELTVPLNKDEDFNNIDSDFMDQMRECYFASLDLVLNNNIRHVAISDTFMSLMYLSENPYEILGKPFSKYTFYQKDLISYGVFYKRILTSDPQPPDLIKSDPDKLEEWAERSNSSKKLSESTSNINQETSGKMIIGATQEDVKEIFGNENVINVGSEIKKKGRMSMQDLMKLHGAT